MNVETIEAGIAIITMRELRVLWRNASITSATSAIAIARSFFTAFAASSVNVEPSWAMSNFSPMFAYCVSSFGISFRTSALTLTEFASDCFETRIPIEVFPSILLI
jgi:hypothetical protein